MGIYRKFGKLRSSRGFSLPDTLLIVGFLLLLVLTAIIFIDPINIQKRNRDIQRIEALDALNRAILLAIIEGEIVLVDTEDCKTCNSANGSNSVHGDGWVLVSNSTEETGLDAYLDKLPVDPINKPPFVYKFVSTSAQGYKLAVPFESAEYQVKMRVDGGVYEDLYEIGTDLSLEF